jgi:hypothetical protein
VVNRLAALSALAALLNLAGLGVALAQAPAAAAAEPAPRSTASPLTLDDILEQSAQAEAAAEPSEEEAETNGLPAAPIPYNNLISADDLDRRIRGASAAAQTLQGPLDGRWSLADQDGAPLYTLLFVDNGRGMLEGAWRDVTRGAGLTATGVIDNLSRNGAELIASFYPRPGQPTVSLSLLQLPDGTWTGDLDQGGARRGVRLLRDEPLLAVAPVFGASGVVSPYRTAATQPAPARVVKKVTAKKKAVKKKASAKKKATAKKRVVRKKA